MVFQPALTFRFQTGEDKEDRKLATNAIKEQMLTDGFVLRLMEVLVTRYFVLRPSDLREWEAEPDEWERREEEIADAWEFSLRTCSEKLFLDLVINFKELLVPRLLQVFQEYSRVDNTDVLLKDSLYAAIGIAAACLDDVLDFNTFLRSTLIPEVQLVKPGYNLLRRRTAVILAQWVPILPEGIDRFAVYQIFAFLLQQGDPLNDSVVRVTAGRQLRMVLEPFEFKYEDFAPYATPILSNIMLLTSETELSETKMALLETVRVAVTKLEGQIEPYAAGIMNMLPPLWAQSGEEHLMKQAIITMITAIVNSLREKSLTYHVAVLTIISDSIQPESEAAVYLLEEALELWNAILVQTPSHNPTDELLALMTSVLPLLDMGSELLQQLFDIIESYIALSPSTVLAPTFLTPLVMSLKSLLPMLASSRARDASHGPHVLEHLAAAIALPENFNNVVREQMTASLFTVLVRTGYLAEVLRIIKEAYEYHKDPRPNRRPPDVIGPGETSLFTLLSRLALLFPSMFIDAINSCSDDSAAFNWLVIEWIGHFDAIGDVLRKKLQVLGITALLTASSPPPLILLEQLQSLITIWTDLATELGQEAAEESQGDYLWWYDQPSNTPDWENATPEDRRKRVMSNNDPIYTTNIRQVIGERLRFVVQSWPGGQQAFEQEWLSRIDPTVMQSFLELKLL
ncbi:Importin-11 [Cyphellophora attinorum]|uniref:Importin-11 n=1 Tax=Cyphellophora attinorum TaxID=1664694 RepID=A0A0N0NN34_9EURO|nr:Importin-11 [Phialophora attinorum]KPI41058.1 Importin-11 [Phialophora attinorum]